MKTTQSLSAFIKFHPRCTRSCAVMAAGALFLITATGATAQNSYTFGGSTTNHWLLDTSWTGGVPGTIPGVAGGSAVPSGPPDDIAIFDAVKPSGSQDRVTINMNQTDSAARGTMILGTIRLSSAVAANFGIHNKGGISDGTLTLTGNTINSIEHTILSNESNYSVRFWDVGNGGKRLFLALGNATANVVQIQGDGDIRIEGAITSAPGVSSPNLTLTGSGTGALVLAGSNSYGGTTFVESGRLVAASQDALGSSQLILGGASQQATLKINTGINLALSGAGTDR